METTHLHWQLGHLMLLSRTAPDHLATILERFFASEPDVLEELTLSAVAHEDITVTEAAGVLRVSEEEVIGRMVRLRQQGRGQCAVLRADDDHGFARLADSGLAVWELVREHRRLGSFGALPEHFPSVREADLTAAIAYADANCEEIEEQIRRYEDLRALQRAQFSDQP